MSDIIKVYVVGEAVEYANFIKRKFTIARDMSIADIAIFTGGEDVSPQFYGEPEGRYTSSNLSRDLAEQNVFERLLNLKIPMIGICRGAQFLTVMSGGSLIQNVTKHAISGTHEITTSDEGRFFEITSTHHQMMFPYTLNDDSYKIIASSSKNLSTEYLDGYNDGRYIPNFFVEPEIVYYTNTNCLCIQGHPECMPKTSKAVEYINMLVDELFFDDDSSKKEVKKSTKVAAPQLAAQQDGHRGVRIPQPAGRPLDLEDFMRGLNRDYEEANERNRQNRARVVEEDFIDIL